MPVSELPPATKSDARRFCLGKERKMEPKEIIEQLQGLKEGQYNQGGEFTLILALAEANNTGLLCHALEIAHLNGMIEATENISDRAQNLKRNCMIRNDLLRTLVIT